MLLKKYSDFGGGKKNNLIQFLSYNLMLNSGKKICTSHDKIFFSNSCDVLKTMSERKKTP